MMSHVYKCFELQYLFGGPKWGGGGLAGGVVAPGASFKGGGGAKLGSLPLFFQSIPLLPVTIE